MRAASDLDDRSGGRALLAGRAPTPIVYDVTRLFLGPLSRTPRGIDRVDITLARHFFAQERRACVGIMPSTLGVRIFDRARVLRALDRLEALWQEADPTSVEQTLRHVRARLVGGQAELPANTRAGDPLAHKAARMLSLIGAARFSLGADPVARVPRGAAYLNVGHYALAVPAFLRWLRQRPDVTSVLMVHDVIPLEAPHFVAASSARHHATMVASTARHADGLLVSTRAAGEAVRAALARQGRGDISTRALPLPLSREFDHVDPPAGAAPGASYFVICGAIEPRKNHALLLEAWRRLRARMGEGSPHLLIIGAPGWGGAALLQGLAAENSLAARVHLFSRVPTPALKLLIRDAAGLLMPSFAEGYGLPLAEAQRLGVPVIASDIPAHCEVAREGAVLLDPNDPAAWADTIVRWMAPGGRPQPQAMSTQEVRGQRQAYLAAVEDFLDDCAQAKRVAALPAVQPQSHRHPILSTP